MMRVLETFKVAVCAAMACAVTVAFAGNVRVTDSVNAEGRPASCRDVTAVLRER